MFIEEQVLFGEESYEDSPFDREAFKGELLGRLQPFIGMDIVSIARDICYRSGSKDSVRNVMDKVLAADKAGLRRAKIMPKIYVVYPNAPGMEQHMSFKAFKFCEVKNIPWEKSYMRGVVEDSEFLFMVFENPARDPKRRNDENIVFKAAYYWKMPANDVAEVKRVYNETRRVILSGVRLFPVTLEDGRVIKGNNLPSPGWSEVCHVRPHGSANNMERLDNGEYMNRQSFWLNSSYVSSVIRQNMPYRDVAV